MLILNTREKNRRMLKIPADQLFIIAEIANAHSGSIQKLNRLVDKIIQIRPDAIKFQLFKTEELLVKNHPDFQLYKKLEIPDHVWKQTFRTLTKTNIKIFADVFSIDRAKFANSQGVDGFKIHSSDINNIKLLNYVASTSKPILLSCSGCTTNEIDTAINTIRKKSGSQLVLMHGFQGFPTRISQINLKRIRSLKSRYDLPIGYMDHISGDSELAVYMPLIAVGMGATVIEKHITLNRDLKEEDYQSSLNPNEFATMIKLLQNSQSALGNASFEIKGDELVYRKNMKKKWISSRTLNRGYKIKENDITLKRIHIPYTEIEHDAIVGGIAKKTIKKEEPFSKKNTIPKIKVAAIVACRVESTRLFAKPLQLVGGKTILELIIHQLRQCKLIDEIVLAISEKPGNEIFVDFAKKYHLKFVRGDDRDVLQRVILAAEHVNANIVFRVTSEDPYKYWQMIDDAIKQHIKSGVEYTTSVDDLPKGAGFEVIDLAALKKSHKNGTERNRSELVTSYIKEHKNKFKIKRLEIPQELQTHFVRLTVDYPEDLILVRTLWSKLFRNKKLPDLQEIIKSIDNDSEINRLHELAVKRSSVK